MPLSINSLLKSENLEDLKSAISLSGAILRNIDENRLTKEVLDFALENDAYNIKHIPKHLQTKEMIEKVGIKFFTEFRDDLKTKEICEEACKDNIRRIAYLPYNAPFYTKVLMSFIKGNSSLIWDLIDLIPKFNDEIAFNLSLVANTPTHTLNIDKIRLINCLSDDNLRDILYEYPIIMKCLYNQNEKLFSFVLKSPYLNSYLLNKIIHIPYTEKMKFELNLVKESNKNFSFITRFSEDKKTSLKLALPEITIQDIINKHEEC